MKLVTPAGTSGFTSVDMARGFKGADEDKKFTQEILLTREDGEKFLQELTAAATKLRDKEYERAKAIGKVVRSTPVDIPHKELGDMISFSFRRKDIDGNPAVIDKDNNPFSGRIQKGYPLQVAFELRPYIFQNKISFSLKLLGVKVLGTEESATVALFGEPTKTQEKKKEDVTDLF